MILVTSKWLVISSVVNFFDIFPDYKLSISDSPRPLTAGPIRIAENFESFLLVIHEETGRIFPLVVVSILPHADFRQNDNREDALTLVSRLLPVKILL